jgi:ABC-2 type transport system permease protein
LLRTNKNGGTLNWDEVMERSFMGSTVRRARNYFPSGDDYTLAAHISGKLSTEPDPLAAEKKDAKKAEPKAVEANVILVADLDMISDQFFELRKRPTESMDYLNFDNVTFILNCVDSLSGDDSFIALRKRRPHHRTLLAVEAESQRYIKATQKDSEKAEDEAKKELADAQKRLDARVDEVRNRKDMDDRTKQISLDNLQAVENRRFEVTKAGIEDKKRKAVRESKDVEQQAIQGIHNRIKTLAILLPPLPALILACLVFAVRHGRENVGANPNRLA